MVLVRDMRPFAASRAEQPDRGRSRGRRLLQMRSLRAVVAALAMAASSAVSAAPAAPEVLDEIAAPPRLVHVISCAYQSPDGVSTSYNASGLATMRLDGTDRRVLTTEDGLEPSWSPDGTWIAYSGEGSRVRAVRADGAAQLDLGAGSRASWSPDGRTIAWGVFPPEFGGDPAQVLVLQPVSVNADNNLIFDPSTRREIPVPYLSGGPLWSPDGNRLAFTARETFRGPSDLYVADLRSGDIKRLTMGLSASFGVWHQSGGWSPTGDEIAFFSWSQLPESGVTSLYIVRADGTRRRKLDALSPRDDYASWSPLGGVLAVTDVNRAGIRLLLSSTGERIATVASNHRNVSSPSWSPDGLRIFFQSWGDSDPYPGNLYSMSTAGADIRRLTEDQSVFGAVITPSPGIVRRVFGSDRIGTAVALSRRSYDSANAAVIARADQYADGLAGAPLAAEHHAPLLLTPSHTLDARVGEELERLGATTAYLLGGATALSPSVDEELRAHGVTEVIRMAGDDRFETAARIALELGTQPSAYLAEGINANPSRGWPDAVAAGAVASATGAPILLTPSGTLPEATLAAIRNLGVEHVTIVGGSAAVSDEVAEAVRRAGVTVERIAGRDRYETSVQLAEKAVRTGLSPATPVVASAGNWPDSLTSGAAAAQQRSPLLLIDGNALDQPTSTTEWLTTSGVQRILAVGGNSAVTLSAEAGLERLAVIQPPSPQPLTGGCV